MQNTEPYGVLDVARLIINKAIDKGKPISNLQLQKILYYVQAAFLIKHNKPCFKEDIINWRHGPVVEEAYHEYKYYSSGTIEDRQDSYLAFVFDSNDKSIKYTDVLFNENLFAEKDKKLIKSVSESFLSYSAFDLVDRTHEERPWIETNNNQIISNDSIKNYFKGNKERIFNLDEEVS